MTHTAIPVHKSPVRHAAPLMALSKGLVGRCARDPRRSAARAIVALDAGAYGRAVSRWARRHGLEHSLFFLSFDCDTDRDIEAVGHLHPRLVDRGLAPMYAVPGEILQSGAAVFEPIAVTGAVFLNHGFRRHADVDPATGAVRSMLSYSDLDEAAWHEDVRRGHRAVQQVTGQAPRVFRTPHFASFSAPSQLRRLYPLLADLDYLVSTSTGPLHALMRGPLYEKCGVIEIPVSGCLDRPAQIVDSWGFVGAANARGRASMHAAIAAHLRRLLEGPPTVVNLYFDPADVCDDETWLDLMARIAPWCEPDMAAARVLSLAGQSG